MHFATLFATALVLGVCRTPSGRSTTRTPTLAEPKLLGRRASPPDNEPDPTGLPPGWTIPTSVPLHRAEGRCARDPRTWESCLMCTSLVGAVAYRGAHGSPEFITCLWIFEPCPPEVHGALASRFPNANVSCSGEEPGPVHFRPVATRAVPAWTFVVGPLVSALLTMVVLPLVARYLWRRLKRWMNPRPTRITVVRRAGDAGPFRGAVRATLREVKQKFPDGMADSQGVSKLLLALLICN